MISDKIKKIILAYLESSKASYPTKTEDDFWEYITGADSVQRHRTVYLNETIWEEVVKIGDHYIQYFTTEPHDRPEYAERIGAILVEPHTITLTTYKPINND